MRTRTASIDRRSSIGAGLDFEATDTVSFSDASQKRRGQQRFYEASLNETEFLAEDMA
jgi:hypothetical protein